MDQTLTVRLIPTSRGNLLSLYARPWQQHTHTQKKGSTRHTSESEQRNGPFLPHLPQNVTPGWAHLIAKEGTINSDNVSHFRKLFVCVRGTR